MYTQKSLLSTVSQTIPSRATASNQVQINLLLPYNSFMTFSTETETLPMATFTSKLTFYCTAYMFLNYLMCTELCRNIS